LLNRKGDTPLWLCEGLACYCEATDRGTWLGIGEPNHERLQALAQALQGGSKLIPLKDLITSDAWMGNGEAANANILTGYAESWALFKELMEEQPRTMRTYLKSIEVRSTPAHRLADFCQAFGDVNAVDQRLQRYVADQLQKHYRPKK